MNVNLFSAYTEKGFKRQTFYFISILDSGMQSSIKTITLLYYEYHVYNSHHVMSAASAFYFINAGLFVQNHLCMRVCVCKYTKP